MTALESRTDPIHETERRHEGRPDMSDSIDVGGENHGTKVASGPGSDGVLAMAATE